LNTFSFLSFGAKPRAAVNGFVKKNWSRWQLFPSTLK